MSKRQRRFIEYANACQLECLGYYWEYGKLAQWSKAVHPDYPLVWLAAAERWRLAVECLESGGKLRQARGIVAGL